MSLGILNKKKYFLFKGFDFNYKIMNESKYVKPKEATVKIGLSIATLRRMGDSGEIPCIKTRTGRYLYDISKFLPSSNTIIHDKQKIAYARVSGRGQKVDLENQIKYLQEKFPTHKIISDYGSGLNFKRKGLKDILDLAYQGKLEEVVVTYKDRLCRFGFELIEYIVESQSNAKIVVLNNSSTSAESELSSDLLSIITVFSARMHGLRRYKTKIQDDKTLFVKGIPTENETDDREPQILL